MKRLRQLEHENGRLKKVLAERVMDIEILKDVAEKMVSALVRRHRSPTFATGSIGPASVRAAECSEGFDAAPRAAVEVFDGGR